MNAAGRRRLTPPLAALAALLALIWLVCLAGVGRGVHWAAPRPPAPLPPRQDAKLPAPVPLPHYAVVWQQPLFSPDRKPEARAASSSQLGDMQLTGIIVMPGLHMALLHSRKGADVRVREGDKLPDGSATLVELRDRSAVFDSSNGRVELKLPAAAPITSAPTPAKAGSGPGNGDVIPDELPEDDTGRKSLEPPEVRPGGTGPSKDDNARPGDQTPQSDQSNAERQANRLRLLRAAIQRRRAAEAAAAAKKGD